MNDELDLAKKIKQKREYVLRKVEPQIKRQMKAIPNRFRDDVEQEVRIKLFQSIDKIKFENIPTIFEFIVNNQKRRK
ncbi:hypothetical protein [Shouchella clausii]|uniref:hypothetical protein n=1 Tax=Shouchella clausii TaxID=79880 RepID=UPI000B9762C0|nr:hypothetical protein [Shouchella clausii]AST94653.1 hypothetical protein BC8716_00995 [Shouchella clausii]MCR1290310.1 hypothetical protein [Shouchella clausii]MEB5474815.1 hypothetical protein [Shouchella clausii]MEB5480631.1 hypothetical protein [Shouchella clausii]PTL21249.1 hypothetical protein DA802_19045 [Shouchella clausii]